MRYIIPLLLLASSAQAQDLSTLHQWMQGAFSSEAQAAQDSDYHPITLHMAPIFSERNDGLWLYVEQAVATKKPYRQRLYRLSQTADGRFESAVFTMADPKAMIGAWNNPEQLAQLTFERISQKQGCEITMSWNQDKQQFIGATTADNCKSSLYGAAYATAETVISAGYLTSWDRGFDAEGNHKWGAEKGGYRFDKL